MREVRPRQLYGWCEGWAGARTGGGSMDDCDGEITPDAAHRDARRPPPVIGVNRRQAGRSVGPSRFGRMVGPQQGGRWGGRRRRRKYLVMRTYHP